MLLYRGEKNAPRMWQKSPLDEITVQNMKNMSQLSMTGLNHPRHQHKTHSKYNWKIIINKIPENVFWKYCFVFNSSHLEFGFYLKMSTDLLVPPTCGLFMVSRESSAHSSCCVIYDFTKTLLTPYNQCLFTDSYMCPCWVIHTETSELRSRLTDNGNHQ